MWDTTIQPIIAALAAVLGLYCVVLVLIDRVAAGKAKDAEISKQNTHIASLQDEITRLERLAPESVLKAWEAAEALLQKQADTLPAETYTKAQVKELLDGARQQARDSVMQTIEFSGPIPGMPGYSYSYTHTPSPNKQGLSAAALAPEKQEDLSGHVQPPEPMDN